LRPLDGLEAGLRFTRGNALRGIGVAYIVNKNGASGRTRTDEYEFTKLVL
jgi:hypothetical protein